MTIEPECMGQADLVSVLQESGPQCLLESDCCTDDRLGYVPMRVILAPIFSPVPTHSLSPPKEEMRSTLAGDSVFFLFSASLSYLGVLGDNPFLGSCRTKGQCAEAPMKRHIAEDAEAAEARREKQKQDLPYFRTPAPRMASSAFLARATLARMSLADFVQMKGFGAALWFAMSGWRLQVRERIEKRPFGCDSP